MYACAYIYLYIAVESHSTNSDTSQLKQLQQVAT